MLSVCDVVEDPLSGFLKAESVGVNAQIKGQIWKTHDLITSNKRWAQRQRQNLIDIMSLDCQQGKIQQTKALTKACLKQTKLVYILNTTGAS